MALFNECTQWCAHIVLDIADIVREAIFQQLLTVLEMDDISIREFSIYRSGWRRHPPLTCTVAQCWRN
jgi:hypothetical protein